MALAPGSYGKVKVEDSGTLELSAGEYFFDKLDVKKNATVAADISGGEVEVNVDEKVKFDKDSELAITPALLTGSRFVTVNSMKDIEFKDGAVGRGNFLADKKVKVDKNAQVRGAIGAKDIEIKEGASFVTHSSTTVPPPPRLALGSEDAFEAAVTLSAVPEEFALSQNYPNPFNPSTTIEFALPEARHVRVAVFDVLGRQVALVMDSALPSGYHQIQWEARNLPTGIYFYQLIAGDFKKVRQMILIK